MSAVEPGRSRAGDCPRRFRPGLALAAAATAPAQTEPVRLSLDHHLLPLFHSKRVQTLCIHLNHGQ